MGAAFCYIHEPANANFRMEKKGVETATLIGSFTADYKDRPTYSKTKIQIYST